MYGELKRFIKPFTMLETFSNIQNSYQKILQKIQFLQVSTDREESRIYLRLFSKNYIPRNFFKTKTLLL